VHFSGRRHGNRLFADEMDKTELRSVIKYLFLKHLSSKEIHDEMTAVLGQHNVSYSTVKKWVAHFKCGNSSTYDEPRSGRPSTFMSDDNITKAEAIVQSDRHVTVRYVAKTIGVSYGSAETSLTGPTRYI